MNKFYGSGQDEVFANFDAVGIPLSVLGDSTAAAVTTTAAELNALHSQGAVAADFAKLHAITASAAEINKVDALTTGAYLPVVESRTFTASGAGTYTATVTIPANSLVLDVAFNNVVVWDSATSASLVVGDAGVSNGFIEATNVKTTPAVGTTMSSLMSSAGTGAYKGLPKWYESQAVITATLTAVGAGSAGRSRLNVIYMTPTGSGVVEATKA